jgi:hypothetical protein
MRAERVAQHLRYIGSLVLVSAARALCDGCVEETLVYWLAQVA